MTCFHSSVAGNTTKSELHHTHHNTPHTQRQLENDWPDFRLFFRFFVLRKNQVNHSSMRGSHSIILPSGICAVPAIALINLRLTCCLAGFAHRACRINPPTVAIQVRTKQHICNLGFALQAALFRLACITSPAL
jgi:hypothetical protein